MRRWADEREKSIGAVVPLEQVWDLAMRWYPGRDRLEWTRPTPAEMQRIFKEVGLGGPFWALN